MGSLVESHVDQLFGALIVFAGGLDAVECLANGLRFLDCLEIDPGVADAIQRMGASLRFDGTLPDNLREIAILATGRFWTAQYEWYAHAKIALDVGVDEKIVNAMAQRRRPSFIKSDEAAVYEFCNELHEKQSVSDENYAWVVEQLGEAGAVELIALCGYYTIISMTLNVAQTPLPDGEELPLRA